MKRREAIVVLSSAALSASGCGGGSGPVGPAPPPPPPAVPLTTVNGTITLPSGSSIAPSQLTLKVMGQAATPSAGGAFSLGVSPVAPTLAIATDADGNGILAGFLDPVTGASTITPRTTGVVLCWFAMGGPFLPATVKSQVLTELSADPRMDALGTMIGQRVAVNPRAIADGDSQIAAALASVMDALVPPGLLVVAASSRAEVSAHAAAPQLIITPQIEQSGVGVRSDTVITGIRLANYSQRPVTVYVYEVQTTTNGVVTNIVSGSEVKVSISRTGVSKLIDYNIVRDKIPLYSVDTHFMMDENTGYVSVSRFSETTYDELVEALQDLNKSGMNQLVVDLRGNPGGYLNQAVKISDLFISGKKKIVYTEGRRKEFDEVYYASDPSNYEDIPLIILINRGSASASEIVSGAVQDWDRGLIVGETSFGKGLVQRQFDLPDNSALRLTISQYFTPSGRLIQRDYKNKKNKEEYYSEMGNEEEVEGDNINHTSEQDSVKPEYKTGKGRIVYGGGGITPDYIVKSGLVTTYTQNLLRKNIFYTFILAYLDKNTEAIKRNYNDNLSSFKKDFKITDDMMKNFIAFAESKEVVFNEEDYNKDKDYISARLKAQIARNFWKNEGWYSVLLNSDDQITKALTLFNEAKDLAKLK